MSEITSTPLTSSGTGKLRLTGARKLVLRIIAQSDDHPDAETIHRRASQEDDKVGLATVYRALRVLEDADLISRREFGDGRARYEIVAEHPHDHLINLESGELVEFHDPRINELTKAIADRLGFELRGHRLEIFGVKKR